MPLTKIVAVAVAAVLAAGLATAVPAQDPSPDIAGMSPEQKVERRQEIMRQNGGFLGSLGEMEAGEASAAAQTMIQNFTDLPVLFAEGTIVGDSRALPIIWEEKNAFDAILATAKGHATAIKAAADAGDTAAIGAEVEALGGLCGQCHGKYRRPAS
jgi:cytochrome c556